MLEQPRETEVLDGVRRCAHIFGTCRWGRAGIQAGGRGKTPRAQREPPHGGSASRGGGDSFALEECMGVLAITKGCLQVCRQHQQKTLPARGPSQATRRPPGLKRIMRCMLWLRAMRRGEAPPAAISRDSSSSFYTRPLSNPTSPN